jgi:hypothetical protein
MKLVMLPLVFSVAVIAFTNRDKIIDQYNAAYPSDPAKAAALQECISRDKYFNRLDGDDRQACYRQHMPVTPIAVAPSAGPQYAYSPSGLPGNDIRREQANGGYPPVISPARADSTPRHAGVVAHRIAAPQPQ